MSPIHRRVSWKSLREKLGAGFLGREHEPGICLQIPRRFPNWDPGLLLFSKATVQPTPRNEEWEPFPEFFWDFFQLCFHTQRGGGNSNSCKQLQGKGSATKPSWNSNQIPKYPRFGGLGWEFSARPMKFLTKVGMRWDLAADPGGNGFSLVLIRDFIKISSAGRGPELPSHQKPAARYVMG